MEYTRAHAWKSGYRCCNTRPHESRVSYHYSLHATGASSSTKPLDTNSLEAFMYLETLFGNSARPSNYTSALYNPRNPHPRHTRTFLIPRPLHSPQSTKYVQHSRVCCIKGEHAPFKTEGVAAGRGGYPCPAPPL